MRNGLKITSLVLCLLRSVDAGSAESTIPATPGVEIDRIEINGVSSFTQEEIEEALEVAPGDKLERIKVLRSAENLQAFYRIHGYEQMSIRTQLLRKHLEKGGSEAILEFNISEGKPTRVASVKFIPGVARDQSIERYWIELEPNLDITFGFEPGNIFDQEKVSAGRRALQNYLASREFVGARITDVRVQPSNSPVEAESQPTGRWISLEVRVDLGDRVSFGFRGNTVVTQNRLYAIVEEEKLRGFGKDYAGAIRLRIIEEYRALGFSQVSVQSYSYDLSGSRERHISYAITEGPRVKIESVDFDGTVAFTNSELRDKFFSVASVLVQHLYYYEKDVEKAAELVVEWMKSKGYLQAKLITINKVPAKTRAGEKGLAFRLILYIYEGDQTLVRGVHFKGITVLKNAEVKKILGIEENTPWNPFAFSEGIETLKTAYRARGFLSVSIVGEGTEQIVQYSHEGRSAEIHLEVSEGLQYRLSRLQIDGHSLTKEKVIRREVVVREGEVLEEPKITETEERLRKLGIFSMVALKLSEDPDRPGYKALRITVAEGTPGLVAGGPGFRNDLGVRAFGEVSYGNLWGLNHTLAFDAAANRRIDDTYHFGEYQIQLYYLWPWFVFDEVLFRPTIALSGTQYQLFDAYSASFAATWEKVLYKSSSLKWTGLMTYSLERIRQFNVQDPTDEGTFLIGGITPALTLDGRDNSLAPSRGYYISGSQEIADYRLGSQRDPAIAYTRSLLRADYFIPMPKDISWFLSFRTGFERSTLADTPIPLSKLFVLGGAGSLRGFGEQELNPKESLITGTLSYVNYRTQLDFPFAGALRFGPFLDGANLLVDQYSFYRGVRFGAGFGFHYKTPVGPVNFDIGFKLNPRINEESTKVYFSIGII